MRQLEERVAVARGAAGDIDLAMAQRFGEEGMSVGLADSALSKYGWVHVACNNAGVGTASQGSMSEHELDDWAWSGGSSVGCGAWHRCHTGATPTP